MLSDHIADYTWLSADRWDLDGPPLYLQKVPPDFSP